MANNVNFNINAYANFSQVETEISKLKASIATLQSKPLLGTSGKQTADEIQAVQKRFDQMILSTRAFNVELVKATDHIEQLGSNLERGKLGLHQYYQLWKNRNAEVNNQLNDLADSQARISKSFVIPDALKTGYSRVITSINSDLKTLGATQDAVNIKVKALNSVIRGMGTELINLGKNTQWTGRQLTVGLTVPMMAFGAAATKAFQDVDKELTRMAKVYGDGLTATSQKTIDSIRKQTLELANELASAYGMAAQQTAATAADLAATGLKGQELLKTTREVMRLSTLGEVDQQTAMKATIALQRTFKLSTDETAKAVDFLNAVENQTSTSMSDLVDALPRASNVVQQLGGSYKDLAAMMVALREAGVPAAEGANAIKSAMASLINPSSKATKEFQAFNINIKSITDKNAGNLLLMINDLATALDRVNPQDKARLIEDLFGKFQFSKITALINNLGQAGSQTEQVFRLSMASTTQLATLAQKELEKQANSVSGKYNRAIQQFRSELLPLGEQFTKWATKAMNIFSGFLNIINKFGALKNVLVGALGGAAIVGPVLMLSGLFINLIGSLVKGANMMRMFRDGFKGIGTDATGLKGAFAGIQNYFEQIDVSSLAASKSTDMLGNNAKNATQAFAILNREIEKLRINILDIAGHPVTPYIPNTSYSRMSQEELTALKLYEEASKQQGGERPHYAPKSEALRQYMANPSSTPALQAIEAQYIARHGAEEGPRKFRQYFEEGQMSQYGMVPQGSAAGLLQRRYGTENVIYGPQSGVTQEEIFTRETQRLIEIHDEIIRGKIKNEDQAAEELTRILGTTSVKGQALTADQISRLEQIISQVTFSEQQISVAVVDNLVAQKTLLSGAEESIVELNDKIKRIMTSGDYASRGARVSAAWQQFVETLSADAVMEIQGYRRLITTQILGAATPQQALMIGRNLEAEIALAAQGRGSVVSEQLGPGETMGAQRLKSTIVGFAEPTRKLQSGGSAWVPGSGDGDKVPAMLEPGEFVVNKNAAKQYGGLLHDINFNRAPRFQQGGSSRDYINFSGEPTFTHVQPNLSVIKDFLKYYVENKNNKFASTVKQWLDVSESDPNALQGFRFVGNMGLNLSSGINNGLNTRGKGIPVEYLIQDIRGRRMIGQDPYAEMLRRIGLGNRPEISEAIHQSLMSSLLQIRGSFVNDSYLYRIFPRLIKSVLSDQGIDKNIISMLDNVSEIRSPRITEEYANAIIGQKQGSNTKVKRIWSSFIDRQFGGVAGFEEGGGYPEELRKLVNQWQQGPGRIRNYPKRLSRFLEFFEPIKNAMTLRRKTTLGVRGEMPEDEQIAILKALESENYEDVLGRRFNLTSSPAAYTEWGYNWLASKQFTDKHSSEERQLTRANVEKYETRLEKLQDLIKLYRSDNPQEKYWASNQLQMALNPKPLNEENLEYLIKLTELTLENERTALRRLTPMGIEPREVMLSRTFQPGTPLLNVSAINPNATYMGERLMELEHLAKPGQAQLEAISQMWQPPDKIAGGKEAYDKLKTTFPMILHFKKNGGSIQKLVAGGYKRKPYGQDIYTENWYPRKDGRFLVGEEEKNMTDPSYLVDKWIDYDGMRGIRSNPKQYNALWNHANQAVKPGTWLSRATVLNSKSPEFVGKEASEFLNIIKSGNIKALIGKILNLRGILSFSSDPNNKVYPVSKFLMNSWGKTNVVDWEKYKQGDPIEGLKYAQNKKYGVKVGSEGIENLVINLLSGKKTRGRSLHGQSPLGGEFLLLSPSGIITSVNASAGSRGVLSHLQLQVKGLQKGGTPWVPGSGEGDRVPAMLEPGEFVVNKNAAKQYGGLLNHLNFDAAPRFADGGKMGMVDKMGMWAFKNIPSASLLEPLTKILEKFTKNTGDLSSEVKKMSEADKRRWALGGSNPLEPKGVDGMSKVVESNNKLGSILSKAKGLAGTNMGMTGMMVAQMAAPMIANVAQKAIGSNQIAQGALGGAQYGAQIGSMIPGVGPLGGAIAGVIVGGVNSWIQEQKVKQQDAAAALRQSSVLSGDALKALGVHIRDFSGAVVLASNHLNKSATESEKAINKVADAFKNSSDPDTQKAFKNLTDAVKDNNMAAATKQMKDLYATTLMSTGSSKKAIEAVKGYMQAANLTTEQQGQVLGDKSFTTKNLGNKNQLNWLLGQNQGSMETSAGVLFQAITTTGVKTFREELNKAFASGNLSALNNSKTGFEKFNNSVRVSSKSLAILNSKLYDSGVGLKKIAQYDSLAAAGFKGTAEEAYALTQNLTALNGMLDLYGGVQSAVYSQFQPLLDAATKKDENLAKVHEKSINKINGEIAAKEKLMKTNQEQISVIQKEMDARQKLYDQKQQSIEQDQTLMGLAKTVNEAQASGDLIGLAIAQSNYNDELQRQRDLNIKQAKDAKDQSRIDALTTSSDNAQKSVDKLQLKIKNSDKAYKNLTADGKTYFDQVDTQLKTVVNDLVNGKVDSTKGLLGAFGGKEGLLKLSENTGINIQTINSDFNTLAQNPAVQNVISYVNQIENASNVSSINLKDNFQMQAALAYAQSGMKPEDAINAAVALSSVAGQGIPKNLGGSVVIDKNGNRWVYKDTYSTSVFGNPKPNEVWRGWSGATAMWQENGPGWYLFSDSQGAYIKYSHEKPEGSYTPGKIKYADGGYISGPGTGTSDSIPARLSNGEYVVKASAVSQYGTGFLDAINGQKFANGGLVGKNNSLIGRLEKYIESIPIFMGEKGEYKFTKMDKLVGENWDKLSQKYKDLWQAQTNVSLSQLFKEIGYERTFYKRIPHDYINEILKANGKLPISSKNYGVSTQTLGVKTLPTYFAQKDKVYMDAEGIYMGNNILLHETGHMLDAKLLKRSKNPFRNRVASDSITNSWMKQNGNVYPSIIEEVRAEIWRGVLSRFNGDLQESPEILKLASKSKINIWDPKIAGKERDSRMGGILNYLDRHGSPDQNAIAYMKGYAYPANYLRFLGLKFPSSIEKNFPPILGLNPKFMPLPAGMAQISSREAAMIQAGKAVKKVGSKIGSAINSTFDMMVSPVLSFGFKDGGLVNYNPYTDPNFHGIGGNLGNTKDNISRTPYGSWWSAIIDSSDRERKGFWGSGFLHDLANPFVQIGRGVGYQGERAARNAFAGIENWGINMMAGLTGRSVNSSIQGSKNSLFKNNPYDGKHNGNFFGDLALAGANWIPGKWIAKPLVKILSPLKSPLERFSYKPLKSMFGKYFSKKQAWEKSMKKIERKNQIKSLKNPYLAYKNLFKSSYQSFKYGLKNPDSSLLDLSHAGGLNQVFMGGDYVPIFMKNLATKYAKNRGLVNENDFFSDYDYYSILYQKLENPNFVEKMLGKSYSLINPRYQNDLLEKFGKFGSKITKSKMALSSKKELALLNLESFKNGMFYGFNNPFGIFSDYVNNIKMKKSFQQNSQITKLINQISGSLGGVNHHGVTGVFDEFDPSTGTISQSYVKQVLDRLTDEEGNFYDSEDLRSMGTESFLNQFIRSISGPKAAINQVLRTTEFNGIFSRVLSSPFENLQSIPIASEIGSPNKKIARELIRRHLEAVLTGNWDLHSKNIMFTKNGEPIIVDSGLSLFSQFMKGTDVAVRNKIPADELLNPKITAMWGDNRGYLEELLNQAESSVGKEVFSKILKSEIYRIARKTNKRAVYSAFKRATLGDKDITKELNLFSNEFFGKDFVTAITEIMKSRAKKLPKYYQERQELINSGTSGYADGGYISGPGTSKSDSIPARLSNGEYVVQADAVKAHGVGFLDAINQKKFAGGGVVGSLSNASSGLIPLFDSNWWKKAATNPSLKIPFSWWNVVVKKVVPPFDKDWWKLNVIMNAMKNPLEIAQKIVPLFDENWWSNQSQLPMSSQDFIDSSTPLLPIDLIDYNTKLNLSDMVNFTGTADQKSIWDLITNTGKSIWDYIFPIGSSKQSIWEMLTSAGNTLWTWLNTSAQNIWALFTKGTSTLWSWLATAKQNVWDLLDKSANNFWTWINAAGQNIWALFTKGTDTLWSWIGATGTKIWDLLPKGMDTLWTWIGATGQNIWTLLDKTGYTLWSWLATPLQKVWELLTTAGNTFWNWLGATGTKWFDLFATPAKTFWSWLGATATNWFDLFVSSTKTFWSWLGATGTNWVDLFAKPVNTLWSWLGATGTKISSLFTTDKLDILGWVTKIKFGDIFSDVTSSVNKAGQTIWNWLTKADGGYISGPGTGTSDSIPAMLSNGEFVVKASAVSKYGVDMLNALNSGNLERKFSTGGLVKNYSIGNSPAMGNSSFSDNSVYNITVSVDTNANPDDIANAVMRTIERQQKSFATTRNMGSVR